MATPHEKLAESLEALHGLQAARRIAIRSQDLSRTDPFAAPSPMPLMSRETSPGVNRIRILWESMREPVLEYFPPPPGPVKDIKRYLEQIEEVYVTDAYHSLSIEGYRVSPELIDRVRQGSWNPDVNDTDKAHEDALAARGYWQAFQAVKRSIQKILRGELAGEVADDDCGQWYRELFAPSVEAGICQPSDLAGLRSGSVFIRGSKYVPLSHEAVREAMPAFFDLLRNEEHTAVRVVLGLGGA